MTRVVDTSVAVKWLVTEAGSQDAAALIGEDLIAPDLLVIEVANVAWKKWRKGEAGRDLAMMMPEAVASFVTLVPAASFTEAALALAIELKHAVYDCYFLAVAVRSRRRIVTADVKLIEKCRGSRIEALLEPLVSAR